jgi:CheY-like chemotaxis protein
MSEAAERSDVPVEIRSEGRAKTTMIDDRRTVLIVDDDPDILEVVAEVLDLHSVPSLTASDGFEALDTMHTSSDLGLVLLDLMMPRMSGVDVLAEMKRDPALATMPVVVISGNYQTEQAVNDMGADECLVKPLEVNVLLRVVSRFVPVPGLPPDAGDGHRNE